MADRADDSIPAPRPWQVVERRVIADRQPWVTVIDEDLRLPDGQVITNFLRFEIRSFVSVFAVGESESGPLVPLVEQYRIGPRASSLEFPAGFIEDGETPLEAAKRELLEEAGIQADQWRPLGRMFMDGSREAGWANLFLASGARSVQPPSHGDLGDVIVRLTPLDDVRRMWHDGTMRAAVAVMTAGLAFNALAGA